MWWGLGESREKARVLVSAVFHSRQFRCLAHWLILCFLPRSHHERGRAMRKSNISLPTLQPHASDFATRSTTTSKLPSSYHNVRHHYPTRAILAPSPDDPLDTSVLHFPLPPTKSHPNHQAQSSIASSTTLENQGIYALSQGQSASGHQSRRRNLSLDSTLNEKYENAETHSPPASIRSTSRLANSDSTRYNKSGIAQGSQWNENYEEVDLERSGSAQKSGWEKEGRRGKKNKKLMWCFGIVLLVVVAVGVVVGVVYQRRKNYVSRATQEILADDPRTTAPVASSTIAVPTTTVATSTARTSSRLPTTTNSIAFAIPSNIDSIASSFAAAPTPPPGASSIDFAYAIAGVTTTINLPYSIPSNAEARGVGQVQWNSLVRIPDPAGGGTVESLLRFRVPLPSAS